MKMSNWFTPTISLVTPKEGGKKYFLVNKYINLSDAITEGVKSP